MVTSQREPAPYAKCEAPLVEEVEAFAASELALWLDVLLDEAVEVALADEVELEAAEEDAEEDAGAEEAEEDMDMELPLPVIDIAPDPVNVPSAILLVVTTAVLESELLYHGWLNASGIAMMFQPFFFPTGYAAMKASTSVSLISCSKELIPGDLDPSNHSVMDARTDSWV